jgi:hypothetical protein
MGSFWAPFGQAMAKQLAEDRRAEVCILAPNLSLFCYVLVVVFLWFWFWVFSGIAKEGYQGHLRSGSPCASTISRSSGSCNCIHVRQSATA